MDRSPLAFLWIALIYGVPLVLALLVIKQLRDLNHNLTGILRELVRKTGASS